MTREEAEEEGGIEGPITRGLFVEFVEVEVEVGGNWGPIERGLAGVGTVSVGSDCFEVGGGSMRGWKMDTKVYCRRKKGKKPKTDPPYFLCFSQQFPGVVINSISFSRVS